MSRVLYCCYYVIILLAFVTYSGYFVVIRKDPPLAVGSNVFVGGPE